MFDVLRNTRQAHTPVSAGRRNYYIRLGRQLANDPDHVPVSAGRRNYYIRLGRELANDPDYRPIKATRTRRPRWRFRSR